MDNALKFYIDGTWVEPIVPAYLDVIDPSTEEPFARIAVGSAADVDRAVAAAKRAFPLFAAWSREDRIALLERVLVAYKARLEDVATTLSREMGAPITLARNAQAPVGIRHLQQTIATLRKYRFERLQGSTLIVREPIGVCGLITPWNWPINQIALKVAPALAAGCTMVLKPSEVAPLNAVLFSEAMHEAGVPPGVFNMIQGEGATVGEAMSSHPAIDMMSFTGSTRAGILVAKTAADTVKRVAQELGGKSANILLPDTDFRTAVTKGMAIAFRNSGQACNSPTRMFVPADRLDDVSTIVREAAPSFTIGDPRDPENELGPVVSRVQFDRVQALIESGIDEGATVLMGGAGLPEHLNRGYYVRPTVFANVTPDMRIAKEEIFGPVLSILTYQDDEDVIAMANDTPYGLAAYVQSADLAHARIIAARMRAGNVYINYPPQDGAAPFGGYKQSGNGREMGEFGLEEFLEVKAVVGHEAA